VKIKVDIFPIVIMITRVEELQTKTISI